MNKVATTMKKNLKNIKKEIDQEIEVGIEAHTKNLNRIIGPEIDKKIDEIVKQQVDKKTSEVLGGKRKVAVPEKVSKPVSERLAQVSSVGSISECLSGYCKIVLFVSIACYLLIGIALFSCSIFDLFYCSAGPFSGSLAVMAIAIIGLAINFIISLVSSNPRPSLLFSIILDIPLLIAILIFSFSYIGMFIIFFIILIRFIQNGRR